MRLIWTEHRRGSHRVIALHPWNRIAIKSSLLINIVFMVVIELVKFHLRIAIERIFIHSHSSLLFNTFLLILHFVILNCLVGKCY